MTTFDLEKRYADAMIGHALAEVPNECCGLLAGFDGRVLKLYPCSNTAHSSVRFSVDPRDQIAVFKELRTNGWDLLGIYHSHTHTAAYPSPTDIQSAVLNEGVYFIVSLTDPDRPVVRAFTITAGSVAEYQLNLTP